jgi:asparagine synthase (glutamine-hydrolysing)
MCGISGIFGSGDGSVVQAMLARLQHRGPDDGFFVTGQDFALGARRLSILDVEGGRQPIANETGDVWAVLNGELYNYREIRSCLAKDGHVLHTNCDTEVLPHLHEQYGPEMVRHIDGMFAIALWDDKRKCGLLARDRIGKKPLYFHESAGRLYFASEIKALLEIPGFVRAVNLEAVHHFLSLKHVPHPLSIFSGISILPPAHRLLFQPGVAPRIQRYWDVSFDVQADVARMTEDEIVDRLIALLRQGIARRLMGDTPIGFLLSGGLDSTLSTVLAAEMSPRPKTFSLTYSPESTTPGKESDRYWARWTAERYGTEHHEETIAFGSFPDSVRKILACFDEPFAGVTSAYFLSRLVSRHVKVALTGDGADELFGSYLSHRLAQPLANYRSYAVSGEPDLIRPFERRIDYLESLIDDSPTSTSEQPRDWLWRAKLFVLDETAKRALYAPHVARAIGDTNTTALLRATFDSLVTRDPLNRVLEAEFRTVFPDQVLTYVDRLSMAHSLELRTAYLDTEFVTFIGTIPGHLKIKNGDTKHLLKRAALRYFPEEMVYRPKEGFLMPIAQWMTRDLEGYVRDTLHPCRLARHGVFRAEEVNRLVDQLYRPGSDYMHANRVFALIVFQEWYDLYFA